MSSISAPPSGLILLSKQAVSVAVANIDFVDSFVAFGIYYFKFKNVAPVTDGGGIFRALTSADGTTWPTGGSDYGYAYDGYDEEGGAIVGGTQTAANITLSGGTSIGNDVGEIFQGELALFNPSGTTKHKVVHFDTSYGKTGGARVELQGQGRRKATTAVKGMRFGFAGSDMAIGSVIEMYGLEGS